MSKKLELKGTKTEKNLWEAFAGESQARVKYGYYASQARKDGYEQIASVFEETSDNEKEHAKLWFKALHGGKVPSTTENLADAASGEHGEWTRMYKRMARVADAEGFTDIAESFRGVAGVEKVHEARYKKFLLNIEQDMVFKRDKEVVWKCRNCGTLIKSKEAPVICPVCKHPQAFFELRATNWK